MFNLSETKTRTVLDNLFECREENLCALTDVDKQVIMIVMISYLR